jgi:beta-glucosidase-like glycosyl hydrolase/CubicO group peptidase (beta-lactamase class C family)
MSHFRYILFTISILLISSISTYGQSKFKLAKKKSKEEFWVDSVFNSLSTSEKIGQLIIIRAHSDRSAEYSESVAELIRNQKVGGLCFFQGGPERQVNLVNYYQRISKTPLLVTIDGEWGIGMRLDSCIIFPHQMTLGAIRNDSLIYQMGIEVAKQCKAVGVQLNFAPVVDVNNNAKNPVINSRSFGENPELVARKALMYMLGMQSQGILCSAKHFPGHGDTDSDSHQMLPTITAKGKDLDSIHLYPFQRLFNANIASVMAAHLYVPALDSTKAASCLSPVIINDLLRYEMKFKGLCITDALEMKGVSDYYETGNLTVLALLAGNDLLLMPADVATSIDSVLSAMKTGLLDSLDIFGRVKKVLHYKYQAGLNHWTPLEKNQSAKIIHSPEAEKLVNVLFANALTLLSNPNDILPLTTNEDKKVAIVSVGVPSRNTFSLIAKQYRNLDLFSIYSNASTSEIINLDTQLQSYDIVILAVIRTSSKAKKDYGIYPSTLELANRIASHSQLILDLHSNPYSANQFIHLAEKNPILISYQYTTATMEAAAEAIFGGNEINGQLPVSISPAFPQGFGLELKKKRLSFVIPEELNISKASIRRIDQIIENGLAAKAYPGCQVLIAKDGQIFYRKNFGYYSFEKQQAVSDSSIYDLASVTKVLSTTLSTMSLVDQQKIDIDQSLKYYLPETNKTNKENIIIRDLLSHQARLKAYYPFYASSMKYNQLKPNLYRQKAEPNYSHRVSENLYILDSYSDTMFHKLIKSDLTPDKKYLYSDLGMFIMRRIIEKQSGMNLSDYVNKTFYQPLGLQSIGYQPLNRFPKSQMPPTEIDNYFRKDTIQGTVHDQSAAMMGGIEGHAGLFSNSLDVAILSQMLLQKGNYGGQQYLSAEVIEEFTRQQFPITGNRRGLGFDKPLPNHQDGGPSCPAASPKSFGHSGFTGTYFWVDPENQIIVVFLSNRTYPTAANKKLLNLGTRVLIQKEIYSIFNITF